MKSPRQGGLREFLRRYTVAQILVYPFQIIQHVRIGVPNHFNAQGVQAASPDLIVGSLPGVRIAVDFNGKHQFSAVEINDIVIQRLLPGKFQALEAFAPQNFKPQFTFGRGRVVSVSASTGGQGLTVRKNPPPCPPYQGGF